MEAKEFLAEINEAPRALTKEEVRLCLEGADAFWIYRDGRHPLPNVPHALLTSGQHSDGYVNVGAMLKSYPGVRRALAMSLIAALRKVWVGQFAYVVGADTSSTDLAFDVASITNTKHIRMKKVEDEKGKRQVWDNAKTCPLWAESLILHIEELITTSFSALQVRQGIRQELDSDFEINFVPFLPVIVNRSNIIAVERSNLLPLLQLNICNYDSGNCPYCKAGSQAIKPKEGDNWLRLTGNLS